MMHNAKKKENMTFYNEKHVNKGRTDRICSWCGKTIQKGTPYYMLVDMESFIQYPVHEDCHDEAADKCNGDMDEFVKMKI
jgi:ribosomal protein L24E